jgi:hypothetical protein
MQPPDRRRALVNSAQRPELSDPCGTITVSGRGHGGGGARGEQAAGSGLAGEDASGRDGGRRDVEGAAAVAELREVSRRGDVVLLDYTTNGDLADLGTPLSHAALIAAHLEDRRS